MKLVSIIIPVYNREKLIKEAIQSCLNQTYKNIEIVVVNDGSTDNTEKVVEQLQNVSKKIKLINQENQGAAKARITGFNNSNGEYITFLDSDDLINRNYVSLLVKALENTKSSVVLARRYQEMGPLRILYNKYPKFMNLGEDKHYLPTIWVGVTCKLYERNNLELLDFDLKANEDLAFIYYELATKRYIGCDNSAIYTQRAAKNSLARDLIFGNLYHIDNTLKPLEIEKKLFTKDRIADKYSMELEAIFIKNIFERIVNIYQSKCSKEKKESLIICLLKYLNNSYPTWKTNKYYLQRFKGFSFDSRFWVNCASLLTRNVITEEKSDYVTTLNDFNEILRYK